jgi:threonine aldolase
VKPISERSAETYPTGLRIYADGCAGFNGLVDEDEAGEMTCRVRDSLCLCWTWRILPVNLADWNCRKTKLPARL